MVNIQLFEPDRFVAAVAATDDAGLLDLVAGRPGLAPITKHARAVAVSVLLQHDDLGLDFGAHNLSRSRFDSAEAWALAVCSTLPDAEELVALDRFSWAAATGEGRWDAVARVVTHLSKILATGGGGPAPERVAAIIETLSDHEDTGGVFGCQMRGFSIPVVQLAARSVLENSRWFPAPTEFLAECRAARRFFISASFAARKQALIVTEAQDYLTANPPAALANSDDFDF